MLEEFGAIFGARVRELREAAGITQDQLARAISRAGLTWSRARLGQVEAGEGAPDLAAMVAVAAALTELSGKPVRLADLLPDSGVSQELALLRDALSGAPVRRPTPVIGNLPDPRHFPGWGQVEDRVASDLGIGSEAIVLAAAVRLYGRTGSEERDARAGDGASPQKRGRVSRIVIAELAQAAAAELAESAAHDAALEVDADG
jgi:transcriptional regulator with XRE-family HTH domain